MRRLSLSLVLGVAGCAGLPTTTTTAPVERSEPVVATASEPELAPRAIYAAPAARPGSTLACAEFTALLEKTRPRTIAEALARVREERPGYLTHATFAHSSPFDDAGPAYPRAIVYGGDAKTILSFNGHPKQKGFERLQLMCFNDATAKFDLREIAFPAEAANPEAISDLTPNERAEPFVTSVGRGSRECQRCHEGASKPIWDASKLWPGLYGAIADGLFDAREPDRRPIYSALERLQWNVFRDGAAKTGRYAFVSTGSERPNADLTRSLSYLNGRRIVAELQSHGEKFNSRAFAAALMCAPRAERVEFSRFTKGGVERATFGVLPESADGETRELFLSAYYEQVGKEKRNLAILKRYGLTQALPKEPFEEVRAYYRRIFREENLDQRLIDVDVDHVLALREIKRVVEPLGIDVENWSMVFHGGFAFENGAAAVGRTALRATLERPFAETFLKNDPALYAAITARERAEEEGTGDPDRGQQVVCGLLANPAGNPRAPAGGNSF